MVPTLAARRVGGAASACPWPCSPCAARILTQAAELSCPREQRERASPGRRGRCHPRADYALRGRCLGPTEPWVRRPVLRRMGWASPASEGVEFTGRHSRPAARKAVSASRRNGTSLPAERYSYTYVSAPRRSSRISFRVTCADCRTRIGIGNRREHDTRPHCRTAEPSSVSRSESPGGCSPRRTEHTRARARESVCRAGRRRAGGRAHRSRGTSRAAAASTTRRLLVTRACTCASDGRVGTAEEERPLAGPDGSLRGEDARTGRSVSDLSWSGRPPAPSEGLGPLFEF